MIPFASRSVDQCWCMVRNGEEVCRCGKECAGADGTLSCTFPPGLFPVVTDSWSHRIFKRRVSIEDLHVARAWARRDC